MSSDSIDEAEFGVYPALDMGYIGQLRLFGDVVELFLSFVFRLELLIYRLSDVLGLSVGSFRIRDGRVDSDDVIGMREPNEPGKISLSYKYKTRNY